MGSLYAGTQSPAGRGRRAVIKRLSVWFDNMRLIQKFLLILVLAMLLACVGVFSAMRIPYEAYDGQLYRSSAQMITLFADKIQSELDDIQNLSFRILADNVLQQNLSAMRENPAGTVAWVEARSAVEDRVAYFSLWFTSALTLQLKTTGGTAFSQAFGNASQAAAINALTDERVARAAGHNGRAVWLVEEEGESARLFLVREIREIRRFSLDTLATLLIQVDLQNTVEKYRASISQLSSPLSCAIYAEDICLYASDEQIRALEDGDDGYEYMRLGGKDFLCVRFTAANGWRYVTLVDYTDINDTISASIHLTAGAFAAAMATALLVSAWLISAVVRHLLVLLGKFDDFAASGIPVPEENDPYLTRKDEIGRLHRHFNRMTRDYDRMTRDNYEQQRILQEKQMQQLRAQVRPHFLYNTLESIYCLAKAEGNERIATMTNALGKMLRASLSDTRDVVTVAEDLEITKEYLRIQLIRYGDRLRVEDEMPRELMGCRLPAMTLQPLVENAVHHAAEEMLDVCVIRIGGARTAQGVDLYVEDNGPGMDEDILEKLESGEIRPEGLGIGMRNIHRRVQYAFSGDYGLRVQSEPGRTRILIHLPDERAMQSAR